MIGPVPHLFAAFVRPWPRARFFVRAVAAAVLLCLSLARAAYCDTAVRGSMESVELEARDSSVAEILNALSEALPIHYRTSIELNRAVTGTFKGPALKVISRVLKDYDYVVRRNDADEFEVIVIKPGGTDSSKIIATIRPAFAGFPSTEVNTGDPAVKGGPYPDPRWRARSYSRTMQPKTTTTR